MVTLAPDARDNASLQSDSHAVAREMELVKVKGLFSGVYLLWRTRFQVWLEGKMLVEIHKKLSQRERLTERHGMTVKAENSLREDIHSGLTEDQKRMVEYNTARRHRLLSDLQTYSARNEPIIVESGDAPPWSSGEKPVSQHFTKQEIDNMALRAVMHLGSDGEKDEHWESYRKDIYDKLPENIAQELERSIKEFWSKLN